MLASPSAVVRTTRAVVRDALGELRAHGWIVVGVTMGFQLVVLFLALPLLRWLTRMSVLAAGLTAFDLSSIGPISRSPASIGILLVVTVVALAAVSLQLLALVVLTRVLQRPGRPDVRDVLAEFRDAARRLLSPGTILFALYLFVVLPLAGLGVASALLKGVAIPSFVTGELVKSPQGLALYAGFLLVVGYLNVRLFLVLPSFAAGAGPAAAVRESWRLTRRQTPVTIAVLLLVVVTAGLAALVVVTVCILPTVLTDELAPDASPVAAGIGLAVAQAAGLVVASTLTVFAESAAVALHDRRAAEAAGASPVEPSHERRRMPTALRVGAWTAAAAVIAGLATANTPLMQAMHVRPETLVLAHRGFSDGGAENTIPGLEAAAAADADLVEMDVMQSADGGFVVFHDSTLERLTGVRANVGDLTTAELTALTVRDRFGHEAPIPTLREYVLRAQELGMPLLIELKFHGGESDDYVPSLLAELESLDAVDANIFHSLEKPAIERLKALRPDAVGGLILAVAAFGLPDTTADFYVVETSSYTTALRDEAWDAGKGMFTWTVNDGTEQRRMLRDEVDGMITDHPDTAIEARTEMDEDDGLADTLGDLISRFVTFV